MAPRTDFPPVRAVLFDMDGLLIDSEDAYTRVTNIILAEHNRPNLPWTIKAQLQGRPGPGAGRIFRAWAQLPISEAEFMARQKELQAHEFAKCAPLPGVQALLKNLEKARTVPRGNGRLGNKVRMAVATSSSTTNFRIKTRHMKEMFSVFPERQVIDGDDERVPDGRGKPLPDIYLLALQVVNAELESEGLGEQPITPEECLVFEDSVPGVEAGRRAGMRVVWVPHPGLLGVFQDRIEEVLAGTTGQHNEADSEHKEGIPLAGSPGQVGDVNDGWAERLKTLEDFDYTKYGIVVSDERHQSESGQPASPGTTDKELEEMTARADGKAHAKEEGTMSPVPGLAETNPKV